MDVKAIVEGLNEKAKVSIPLEAGDYVGEIEEVLPEAGSLESGKGYREHKMIPFIKKLLDIVKTFYVEYYNFLKKMHYCSFPQNPPIHTQLLISFFYYIL